MQPEIDLISDWMTRNKLTINIDKCEVMCFGSGNPPPLKIKDTTIQCKISCKYLGLHIDKWLRFNQHIEYLVKKLNKFCGLIYRIRHMFPRYCLLMFYNSYAKSLINYGIIAYSATAKTNLSKNEMAQRRIMRTIFFKKKNGLHNRCFARKRNFNCIWIISGWVSERVIQTTSVWSPQYLSTGKFGKYFY